MEKIATRTGSSKWITDKESRLAANRLRHKYDAIMVGIGTVLADDPQLTCRILGEKLHNPTRVVIDSQLKIPLEAAVLRVTEAPTIVYTAEGSPEKASFLRRKGVDVVECPGDEGKVDLLLVLQDLARRDLTGVLVEGGSGINGALLDLCLIDKMHVFIAPKVIGGNQAPGMFGGLGISQMKDAVQLERVSVEHIGPDILVTGYPVYKGGIKCSPEWWKN